tara:strand:- start:264 stop:599 length:336 start_codon:yes stop_codon:yes gene_type:complete
MHKFILNLKNSINGIKEALKEHSFIAEILGGFFLIPYLLIINIDISIKLIIVLNYFLLLAFELLNTSIEKLSNKITTNFDIEIKKIKDLSSASVFITLLMLIILLVLSLFM